MAVEILGVHPVKMTRKLLKDALELKYGDIDEPAARREAEKQLREELGAIVLVEARIDRPDRHFDMGKFGQSSGSKLGPDDQVAYEETFLSEDGKTVVEDFDPTAVSAVRVVFFLHYYDASKPILTPYGPVQPPKPTPMPQRLARLVEYEPVD